MAKASYLQSSFLGGEWSPYALGRIDSNDYRTAMARCYNAIPLEEGAWTRRPGIQFFGHTRGGNNASVREFHFAQNNSYDIELTDGFIRFYTAGALVTNTDTSVVSISGATPAVVTTNAAHGLTTGDQIIFSLSNLGNGAGTTVLMHRQFEVTVTGSDTFTIKDALDGASFDGSTATVSSGDVHVKRILEFTSPFTGTTWNDVRIVQNDTFATLLQLTVPPQNITNEGTTFSAISEIDFADGPYFDPVGEAVQAGQGTLTPSGTSGSITLTASVGHGIPSTDVGRLIRLYNEPAAWDVGTSYSAGDRVSYGGAFWYALTATTGDYPGIDPTIWAVDTQGGFWTWAKVTAWSSATVVTVTIKGNPLPNTDAIRTWRLGLWSVSQGFPTCGTYHQGRLWLAGSAANRIDGSVSNNPYSFAPTGEDGTVADNYAISANFNSKSINQVQWLASMNDVLIAGTTDREWVIRASSFNDPLTPTSIQANPATKYGSSFAEVAETPMSLIYVGRKPQKLVEYVSGTESGKFIGSNLSLKAKHLTRAGVEQIVYQQEPVPILWGMDVQGDLFGVTYKRENPYGTQEPEFKGFHWHRPGNGRGFSSIAVGPAPGGQTDTLVFVSVNSISDPDYPIYWVEGLSRIPDENILINESAYLDSFVIPSTADWITSGAAPVIRAYGLWPHAGKTVTVFCCGVDVGEFDVADDGSIDIPVDAAGSLLTTARVDLLAARGESGTTWNGHNVWLEDGDIEAGQIPIVVGFNYVSRGQIVRPIIPQETGSRIGTALGFNRRSQRAGVLLYNTQGIAFGTDFDHLNQAIFDVPGPAIPKTTLFSGVFSPLLDDTYTYDSMLCWEIDRPYPATVLAVNPYIETQER